MMRKLLFILSLFLVLGCNQFKEVVKVDYELVSKGVMTGAGEEGIDEGNLVIRDLHSWKQLVEKMNNINNISDSFTEVNIDFSKNMVIAVFDKVYTSGGYGLEVAINSDTEAMNISVKKTKPEGMTISIINQPYFILKTVKTNKEVVFKNANENREI